MVSQGIDPAQYRYFLLNYNEKHMRFFYFTKKCRLDEVEAILQTELTGAKLVFGRVYCLEPTIRISDLACYQSGKIFAMDLGSIIAILALNPLPGNAVLDCCCAPGGKLLLMAEKTLEQPVDASSPLQTQTSTSESIIFANDLSEPRLNIAKSILSKYGYTNSIKFLNKDATTFHPSDFAGQRFDKVICDVECTHDGSFKHILKYIQKQESTENTEENHADPFFKQSPVGHHSSHPGSICPGPIRKISKKEQKRRLHQKLNSGKSDINRERVV